MELREIIGGKLKELRVSNRLSQNDIAKELNITQAAVAQYESGRSAPSSEILLWYADKFDVSLDYIYGRQDSKNIDAKDAMFEEGTIENEKLKEIIAQVINSKK